MNIVKGQIQSIKASNMISIVSVNVDGDLFSSTVMGGKKGEPSFKKNDWVNIIFKETEVGIAKGLTGQISLRNRFPGKIQKIEKGDIFSKIILKYKKFTIESIISTKSTEEMGLQKNDTIEWLVKTNEVSLMEIPQ